MSKKHMGSSIDDFLREEGILEEAQAQVVKDVGAAGAAGAAGASGEGEKDVAESHDVDAESCRTRVNGKCESPLNSSRRSCPRKSN